MQGKGYRVMDCQGKETGRQGINTPEPRIGKNGGSRKP